MMREGPLSRLCSMSRWLRLLLFLLPDRQHVSDRQQSTRSHPGFISSQDSSCPALGASTPVRMFPLSTWMTFTGRAHGSRLSLGDLQLRDKRKLRVGLHSFVSSYQIGEVGDVLVGLLQQALASRAVSRAVSRRMHTTTSWRSCGQFNAHGANGAKHYLHGVEAAGFLNGGNAALLGVLLILSLQHHIPSGQAFGGPFGFCPCIPAAPDGPGGGMPIIPKATNTSGSQAEHGLLLHPGHRPLPLDRHLEVVWQGLPPGQHLIGHDLGSELVKLVLVEGSRTDRTTRTSGARRASRIKPGGEPGDTGSQDGSVAGAWAAATRRAGPVIWTQGVLIATGAV
ncbi:hypothetical protein EYF80_006128 [Liparis tanakae]|uniref:Uncharacterized protein n=1 Tax=Liparis tanakae TaxID=230148 RepID=A0A4Z2J002_9TELE|nr:hypothetical protein EYF80_006128 [Liparis tanakae]